MNRGYSITSVVLVALFMSVTNGTAFAKKRPVPDTKAETQIPSVGNGNVDLKEFKPNLVIDLNSSESRLFQLKNSTIKNTTITNPIIRTSIGDAHIAEPVVLCENQFVLIGRAPGTTTLGLWDSEGNLAVIKVRVGQNHVPPESVIPPAVVGTLALEECKTTKRIDLRVSKPMLFKITNAVLRTSISNPAIAEVEPAAENGLYVRGKAPGFASLFIWDDKGSLVGLELNVTETPKNGDKTSRQSNLLPSQPMPPHGTTLPESELEAEYWLGDQKKIVRAPGRLPDKSDKPLHKKLNDSGDGRGSD